MKQSTKGKIASLIMAGAMMTAVAVPASACTTASALPASRGVVSRVFTQAEKTANDISRDTDALAQKMSITGNAANDIAANHSTVRDGVRRIAAKNADSFANGLGIQQNHEKTYAEYVK